MRRVILGLAVSLDGFIEDPEKGYDWCFCEQDYGMTAFMKEIDTLFIGRKPFERIGVNPFPHKKCYVFPNTLAALLNSAGLINGDIIKRVTTIKKLMEKTFGCLAGPV